MKKPIFLLLVIVLGFLSAEELFGYQSAYQVGYGAFACLAAIIALTFFWLWVKRSTPLALGMAFGWGGAASVMAWWWLFNLLGRPEGMVDNPLLFLFLSVYFVGAVQHLDVIGRSFGFSKETALAPALAAVLFSILMTLFF